MIETVITLATVEAPEVLKEEDVIVARPAHVILFNDDIHTFEEVIGQLIKATGSSAQQAERWALEVHTRGKASVFEGAVDECMRVSGILEEIALHTQIEM